MSPLTDNVLFKSVASDITSVPAVSIVKLPVDVDIV